VELCAHVQHPAMSNGPTENLNPKIPNTKRTARDYRNFTHYRLRLLLNHGRVQGNRSATRIRTRRARFAAWSQITERVPLARMALSRSVMSYP
jgi:Transposase